MQIGGARRRAGNVSPSQGTCNSSPIPPNNKPIHTQDPSDLICTCNICTCLLSDLYPQPLKILVAESLATNREFRAYLFLSVFH